MWILLALVAACGQALGWALKKKVLAAPELNFELGFVSYTIAATGFWGIWYFLSHENPIVTEDFLVASGFVVILNILATLCAYRALGDTAYSNLMAFIPMTNAVIVIFEWYLTGSLPNSIQLWGIALIVTGGICFGFGNSYRDTNWFVIGLFSITLLCYAVASTYMKVMQSESNAPWFSAAVMHAGIAGGFLVLISATWDKRRAHFAPTTLPWMVVAGGIIVLLENGPIFMALTYASASEVFSIKRLMPIAALVIGYFWFKERPTKYALIGTGIMISGAVIISGNP